MGTADEFRALAALYADAKLRPVVDRVFPFAEGEAAFRHMDAGAQFGKIVVAIS